MYRRAFFFFGFPFFRDCGGIKATAVGLGMQKSLLFLFLFVCFVLAFRMIKA
jgi:hypothetical protein